jgi:hypothetical protein
MRGLVRHDDDGSGTFATYAGAGRPDVLQRIGREPATPPRVTKDDRRSLRNNAGVVRWLHVAPPSREEGPGDQGDAVKTASDRRLHRHCARRQRATQTAIGRDHTSLGIPFGLRDGVYPMASCYGDDVHTPFREGARERQHSPTHRSPAAPPISSGGRVLPRRPRARKLTAGNRCGAGIRGPGRANEAAGLEERG